MKDKWMQKVAKQIKKKGTEGTFSRWAKRHHLTMSEAVVKGKRSSNPLIRKRATLAGTFLKAHHLR